MRVLPRICSNHHPICVQLSEEARNYQVRPFRFQIAWQMHDQFEEMMNNSWKGEGEAHAKLAGLQQVLIDWNKVVFGNIEGRKRRLINRLNGVQRSLDRRNNPFLV